MVLIVQQDCPFCTPEIMNRVYKLGGKVLKVIAHPDGDLYLTYNNKEYIPLTRKLPGIPALINEEHVYVGAAPIKEFLYQENKI